MELSKQHLNIIRKNINQSIKWTLNGFTNTVTGGFSISPSTDNGWYSTSPKTPKLGGITYPVPEGPIVEFTCKYGKRHIGVLKSFHYEKSQNKIYPVVVIYEKGINDSMSLTNCIINPKWIGSYPLPNLPNMESFVATA